ncbi:MAG: hypothetical protein A2493_02810 [Candidatus Magasanikbacteria bacterium RIFOXYC12_FULL_33_11]|uniref:Uncharacterized protein n=1 Tax=Candidatus Magasanikbacteria bacterium RIFOXYC12_FULL_33_11 TaxID=1798701 RepID=A0A1F6NP88_9BACT|nr:MAG: hypothetical protein A2493_02810 [Candidatus Magasanikbacteria bacterium RIFOXYC12_FULL_33_11]OGH88941.1 MAG: hypothetical protein A2507_02000 [Candidatus Magasanikbacteria bacterium RIFOXYD12_FULL_33_17]HAO52673.1 hypothetical protein [Candidatus Magasanikbacteria bacterium]
MYQLPKKWCDSNEHKKVIVSIKVIYKSILKNFGNLWILFMIAYKYTKKDVQKIPIKRLYIVI